MFVKRQILNIMCVCRVVGHRLKKAFIFFKFSDPYQGYASQQPGYPPQQYGKDGYPAQGYPSQGYPPNVGFVNPGYPSAQPQPSGFVPLVPPANNPYANPPHISPQHPGAYVDPEDLTEMKGFDFSEETIRRGFIRKVYSILSVSEIHIHSTKDKEKPSSKCYCANV